MCYTVLLGLMVTAREVDRQKNKCADNFEKKLVLLSDAKEKLARDSYLGSKSASRSQALSFLLWKRNAKEERKG